MTAPSAPAPIPTPRASTVQAAPLPGGSWPVMLTLFLEDASIDFPAMERLVEWYLAQGSSGLFATCQSSEIFQLTFEERLSLIRFVRRQVDGRVPVVAGGVIADRFAETLEQTQRIADEGVESVVLLTNQLLAEGEPEDALYGRLERLLSECPGVTFGLYECPHPYKRLLSPEAVGWCGKTGRFSFMKETACDADIFAEKAAAALGTPLKIYAADNPTLLESLKRGAHGYNGILANVWPAHLASIAGQWDSSPTRAEGIQNFIGPVSYLILNNYPASAKYLIGAELGCTSACRVDHLPISPAQRAALDQAARLAKSIS